MARRRMLGQVNLLGLNAFGRGFNPILGMVIGGGVAGTTTLVARQTGAVRNPELVGFGAGLAVSGVMFAMKSTRQAALGSALGAFFASGLAWLEKSLFGGVTVAIPGTVPTGITGVGYPQARALNGLGIAQMRALGGVGYPTSSFVPHAAGAIPGVAGAQLAAPGGGSPPVSLMGTPSSAAIHLMGIGGPPIHGLSAAYGATLLGDGR